MSSIVTTSHFSRLSLDEAMAPTTRLHAQRELSRGKELLRSLLAQQDSSSDDEASDASTEEEDDDEDMRTIVRSPTTKISYDISSLDHDTQSEVRQLFRETPASEPPPLVLQWCQLNQEQQDGQFYAFQLHEVVPRSIRIGSPTSKYRNPRCNCMSDTDKPCTHLIYLLDQLNYFSSDQLLDEPVQKIEPNGTRITQSFEKISNFHLDLLASNLHCSVGSPESNAQISSVRLKEAREILATVAESDADDHAVHHYRSDIFEKQGSILEEHGIVSYSDLTKTVAKMLVTNNDFFAYFLKLLGPTSKARDPFRKIQQHVDRVLEEVDAYSRAQSTPANATEGPRNIPWAAAHITRAVSTIQYLLQNREDAPSPAERASAARTLVRILHTVVFDWNRHIPTTTTTTTTAVGSSSKTTSLPAREPIIPTDDTNKDNGNGNSNLYHCLIGSKTSSASSTTSFVLDTLAQLPEQNQWIETLEEIEAQLATYAPPAEYMRRLRDLVTLMRSSRPPAAAAAAAAASAVMKSDHAADGRVDSAAAAAAAAAGGREGGGEASPSRRRGGAVGAKRSGGEGSGREGGSKRAR